MKPKKSKAVDKPLSESERPLIEAALARNRRAAEVPYFDKGEPAMEGMDGKVGYTVALDKMNELLKTDHGSLAGVILSSASTVPAFKETPDRALALAIQQISALQPQTHLEVMLTIQMIQVNNAASRCMALAFLEGQSIHVKELNVNLATKLQRTFLSQIEALQKLRGKGGQKVTVEHVHVHQGGQAIVGNVEKGGGKIEE